MLNIAYGPDVPPAIIEVVEHHARRLGLPLSDVEEAGASLDAAEAFILAAEEGLAPELVVERVHAVAARLAPRSRVMHNP